MWIEKEVVAPIASGFIMFWRVRVKGPIPLRPVNTAVSEVRDWQAGEQADDPESELA